MSKDWIGNEKTVYAIMGASNHVQHDRQVDDYYATDPKAIDKLLTVEKPFNTIWECACGEGHLSKRLEQHGFNVISTDLIDRGYGQGGIDFLTATPPTRNMTY